MFAILNSKRDSGYQSADMVNLSILRWEGFFGLLKVVEEEIRESWMVRVRKGGCNNRGQRITEKFEDRGRGIQSMECRQPLEWKRKGDESSFFCPLRRNM